MAPPSVNKVPLPPDLFDIYRFYKKQTAAAVSWLASNGKIECKKVDDLITAAQTVVNKCVEPPRELHSALVDALEARMQIARYYQVAYQKFSQGSDDRSEGHEHFTNTLRQIVHLLFPRSDQVPRMVPQGPLVATDTTPNTPQWSNKYAVLEQNSGTSNRVGVKKVDGTRPNDEEPFETQGISGENTASAEDGTAPLEDDTMAIEMEFLHYVMEFDIICSQIKNFWVEAKTGASSVMLAAWLTNTAYHLVNNIVIKAKRSLAIPSHEVFLEKYQVCSPLRDAHLRPLDKYSSRDPDVFARGHGFLAPFVALQHWLEVTQEEGLPEIRSQVFENAGEMISEHDSIISGLEYITKEARCYLSFITGFYERLLLSHREGEKKTGNQSYRYMCPVLPHFLAFTAEIPPTIKSTLIYGIQLHVEVFRAFRAHSAAINCRTMSLRYAKDVHHALQPVLALTNACKSSASVPNGRLEFLVDCDKFLQNYVKEKRWDLYHQSPWTAGNNIIGIHIQATSFGMRLCHSQGSLGAVLHLYHCMIARNIVHEAIPLFDHLIQILKDVCFPGGLPGKNFYTHCCRFLGGKIDFARRTYAVKLTGKRFALGVPMELPHRSDKERRLDPQKLSMFYTLHVKGSNIDDDAFLKLWDGERKTSRAPSMAGISTKNGLDASAFLKELKSRVSNEFEGDFPIGKVNWFAVYVLCRKVLDVLGHHCHKLFLRDATTDVEALDTDWTGVQSVLGILNMVDVTEEKHGEELAGRYFRHHHPEYLRPSILAFQSVDDGNDLSKYRWDI